MQAAGIPSRHPRHPWQWTRCANEHEHHRITHTWPSKAVHKRCYRGQYVWILRTPTPSYTVLSPVDALRNTRWPHTKYLPFDGSVSSYDKPACGHALAVAAYSSGSSSTSSPAGRKLIQLTVSHRCHYHKYQLDNHVHARSTPRMPVQYVRVGTHA